MKKRIKVLCCCIGVVLVFSTTFWVMKIVHEESLAAQKGNRLVGIFVTEDSINLPSSHEKLSSTIGEIQLIDANFSEEHTSNEHFFAGLDGMALYSTSLADENGNFHSLLAKDGISDVSADYREDDSKFSIDLDGTVYIYDTENNQELFISPIYQNNNGDIYLTEGQCINLKGTQPGVTISKSFDENTFFSKNGQKMKYNFSTKINVSVIDKPSSISVFEMDETNEIIGTAEYDPSKLPDSMSMNENTEYIIVETLSYSEDNEAQISREFFDKDVVTIQMMKCMDNGICKKMDIPIAW